MFRTLRANNLPVKEHGFIMYSIADYLYNGCLYLHNLVFPKRKRLSQLMIYSTTRCQSRCRHCSIYKKPDKNLSLEDIKSIMLSRCVTPRTTIGLEGGEFILHPQAAEIMEWFAHNHPNYTLLSNGLFPERVIEYVRLYRPSRICVRLPIPTVLWTLAVLSTRDLCT